MYLFLFVVLVLASTVYFVAVSAVGAWLVLPRVRQSLRSRMTRVASSRRDTALAGRKKAALRYLVVERRLIDIGKDVWTGHRAHLRWWLSAVVVLVLVPAMALWLRHWNAYDGYDHTASRTVNSQVAALLEGEHLVPPAPLPPELFMTREVERSRPAIATASRRWELLDSEFRNRLLAVYRLMREEHGYEMVLLEGYRSPERQAELAGMGPTVTRAAPGESYHQYGLAADSAFMIDGRIVISEQDPRAARGYALYGAVAQSAGLVWGGGWRNLKDLGHVELRRPGVLRSATHSSSHP